MKTMLTATLASLLMVSTAAADDWPRFRGPNGQGHAPPLAIPNTWTADDYAWQADLPGRGHGSPVVLDGKLFITSGTSNGQTFLEAYDARTGERLWQQSLAGKPFQMHQLNAQSSSTPAVDSQHVYLTYYLPGQVQLVAFTHTGQEVWRAKLGEFTSPHGFAASPMVVDDLVCLECDNTQQGYLVALDAQTGNQRWRVTRPTGKEVYSTPAIITLPEGQRVIVSTSQMGGVTAIDPATGKKLGQQSAVLPARTVSSPIVAGNKVWAGCGSGGNGKQMAVCRVTLSGVEALDILPRNIPYVPTGIAVGEHLFLIHERGTMTCFDIASADEQWTKRLGKKYYCSPILLGDRLLCISMDGEAIMLAASGEFRVLGRTDLGEGTQATPAVADGRLFIRTETKLFCLAE